MDTMNSSFVRAINRNTSTNRSKCMHNILFLGGAGFIGSSIVSYLSHNKDCKITVLEPEFASLHRLSGLPVAIHRGELSNIDEIKTLILEKKIDTIVHLVSTLIPGSSFDDYQREFTNVLYPSVRLMEFCSEQDIKFVYFSSGGTIYGDRKGNVTPFKEEDQMAPISFYGWSKQMMENSILFMHRTQHLKYIIIRPSNPYGKGQNLYGRQGLIAVALGKIFSGESIQVWGDGSSVRDYIYIDDLGKAMADILLDENIVNETLNIGSGIGYSVNEILSILREVVDEDVKVEYIAARNVDVSSVVLDTIKLQHLIHFNPREIKDGITRFYQEVKHGE